MYHFLQLALIFNAGRNSNEPLLCLHTLVSLMTTTKIFMTEKALTISQSMINWTPIGFVSPIAMLSPERSGFHPHQPSVQQRITQQNPLSDLFSTSIKWLIDWCWFHGFIQTWSTPCISSTSFHGYKLAAWHAALDIPVGFVSSAVESSVLAVNRPGLAMSQSSIKIWRLTLFIIFWNKFEYYFGQLLPLYSTLNSISNFVFLYNFKCIFIRAALITLDKILFSKCLIDMSKKASRHQMYFSCKILDILLKICK